MAYFSLAEAAQRYEQYRPRVHEVIKSWLADADIPRHFATALDVACGTGHSTLPLLTICDSVSGIDLSQEMLAKALEKELTVAQLPYQQAHTLGQFDLITTCMAFHWFDGTEAILAYKKASKPGAIWLIYNFSFAGSVEADDFNHWFTQDYLSRYPSPARNNSVARLSDDPSISLVAAVTGILPIQLSRTELVGYLTTQSNVEAQILNGMSYQQVEEDLHRAIDKFRLSDNFNYRFSYEIYRYSGSEEVPEK